MLEKLRKRLKDLNFTDEEIEGFDMTIDRDDENREKLYDYTLFNQTRDDIFDYVIKLGGLEDQEIEIVDDDEIDEDDE